MAAPGSNASVGQPAWPDEPGQAGVAGGRGPDGARQAGGRDGPRVGRDPGGPPRTASPSRLEGGGILGPDVQAAVERPGGVQCKQGSGEPVAVRTIG